MCTDSYGQLFTRFVTLGLPNPVAKSQPLCAGNATCSDLSDRERTPNLSVAGRTQLFVPKQGTSLFPRVTSWKTQALPTVLPSLALHLDKSELLGTVRVPNCAAAR